MTIARALKTLRKKILLASQRRMAAQLKTTQATLSRYENGEREPTFAECVKIAKTYPGTAFMVDATGVHLIYSPRPPK